MATKKYQNNNKQGLNFDKRWFMTAIYISNTQQPNDNTHVTSMFSCISSSPDRENGVSRLHLHFKTICTIGCSLKPKMSQIELLLKYMLSQYVRANQKISEFYLHCRTLACTTHLCFWLCCWENGPNWAKVQNWQDRWREQVDLTCLAFPQGAGPLCISNGDSPWPSHHGKLPLLKR